MDNTDKQILAVLQHDGRITNIELAKRVGLTHSACARRIQRLESDGVIRGYKALIDRQAVGLTVHAFIGVTCSPDTDFRDAARRLSKIEHTVSCYVMSGEFDIMLEVLAEDMDSLSLIILDYVLKTQGVRASRSVFVLEDVGMVT